MGFLDNLESLLGVDLSGLKKVDFKLRFFSGNKNNALVRIEKVDKSQHLHINVSASELQDAGKRKALQELIRNEGLQEGSPLLEVRTSEVVEEIAATGDEQGLLGYFNGKIPDSDLPILRAAIYMKAVHSSGRSVENFKQDIVLRYGQRGANIANLCSAGYFESHIRPMYEELKQRPNFSSQLFVDNYNLIIEKAPFAVFVSGAKGIGELVAEVDKKIIANKMYGIHQLNIHAIGSDNVHKLNELLQDNRITKHFSSDPSIETQGRNIMNTQIFF